MVQLTRLRCKSSEDFRQTRSRAKLFSFVVAFLLDRIPSFSSTHTFLFFSLSLLYVFQLSEAPSESGETSAELNGLIEAATGSPIYVTSASVLNSSQSALHRTTVAAAAAAGGGGTTSEESQEGKPSPSRSIPTSTVTTSAVISSGPELSPSKRSSSIVTVVGVNTSSTGSTSVGGKILQLMVNPII